MHHAYEQYSMMPVNVNHVDIDMTLTLWQIDARCFLRNCDIMSEENPSSPRAELWHCVTGAGFRHNPNWSHIHPLARFLATMRLPAEQGNNTHIQKQQNVETHKYAYTATTQMQRYVTRRKSHAAAQKPTTCRKEFRLCSSSQSCVQNFHTQMFKLFKVFKMLKCSKCVQARNHLFFPCSGKFPQSEDFQPCPYFPLGPYVIKRLHSLLPTVRSLLCSEFFSGSNVGLCCPFRLSQWWLLWTFFWEFNPVLLPAIITNTTIIIITIVIIIITIITIFIIIISQWTFSWNLNLVLLPRGLVIEHYNLLIWLRDAFSRWNDLYSTLWLGFHKSICPPTMSGALLCSARTWHSQGRILSNTLSEKAYHHQHHHYHHHHHHQNQHHQRHHHHHHHYHHQHQHQCSSQCYHTQYVWFT